MNYAKMTLLIDTRVRGLYKGVGIPTLKKNFRDKLPQKIRGVTVG